MLDIGWSEFLVVIVVAVLVIGPKDIPKVMHGLGRIMRRIHYLKYAMSQQFEDLMKETELEELRKHAQDMAHDFSADPDGDDEKEADEALLIEGQLEEKEAQHVEENDKPSPDTPRH